MMFKSMLVAAALTAVLVAAFASDANAWSHSGTTSGPNGSISTQGSGSCAGGACSWSGGGSGPAGQTWSRQGSASCAGGTCSGTGSFTGPRGNTRTHSGTVTQ